LTKDPETGIVRRWHMSESTLQKAVSEAARRGVAPQLLELTALFQEECRRVISVEQ